MRKPLYTGLWIAYAIVALVGLYWGLKGSLGAPDTGGLQTLTYRLSITGTAVGEDSVVFKARQGDTITLVIGSDRPGEIHVHGYEKAVGLKPGAEVTLTLVARDAGRFPVHLHDPDGSMRHLAMLEVRPR